MIPTVIPLTALRAFEAAARHGSFTRAGLELRVTQAAISHQVKALEDLLGVALFRRLPRGLALTDEGIALAPSLTQAFSQIGETLDRFERGQLREVVTIGCNGTFASGWLLRHVAEFEARNPRIDLRVLTNNNRVDVAGEGLDLALRFGDGSWRGCEADHLLTAPLAPVCAPAVAARLRRPQDLAGLALLRSYRVDEWPLWFAAAQVPCPALRGPIFDSSVTMAEAAAQGIGVGLAPVRMFERDLASGRLVQPFATEVTTGAYWLTWLKSKALTPGMAAFRSWILAAMAADRPASSGFRMD